MKLLSKILGLAICMVLMAVARLALASTHHQSNFCGDFLARSSEVLTFAGIVGGPQVSEKTIQIVDEILLPNSPLKSQNQNQVPRAQFTFNDLLRNLLTAPEVELPHSQVELPSPDLSQLKMKLFRWINAPPGSGGLDSIIWEISSHWSQAGVSHERIGLFGATSLKVLPLDNESLLNELAFYLKKILNVDLVVDPRKYRTGNAGIQKKVKVSLDGRIKVGGLLYLPLESVIEPQSLSPALVHELVHAVGLEMLKNHDSYVLSGKINRFPSKALTASKVPSPPIGLGRNEKMEYKLPYGFQYSLDELEAHYWQTLSSRAPNKELIFSGLLIAAQLKYLTEIAVKYGAKVVPRSINWTQLGLVGTLAFDFGPPFGLILIEFPLPELRIDLVTYKKMNPSLRSQIYELLERRIQQLGAIATAREKEFFRYLTSAEYSELRYFSVGLEQK